MSGVPVGSQPGSGSAPVLGTANPFPVDTGNVEDLPPIEGEAGV
jgi:hypothetical protein